ncbi:tRNA pseudouridine(55) synthase TruB [Oscillospiraceae bacterium OttesenSCG-928-G22]|nr:tRNA pseudouridine(55) synthase TruB [Oscillospiraceae bacterium OttesenSCG-928-G22]
MTSGLLIVDKPEGLTSHDVVARLRRLLAMRRIGHGGTLDPLATGVLPIFIGKATRASEYILHAEKEYIARFRLGIATDTQDITGQVLRTAPPPKSVDFEALLPAFRGEIKQIPPMYSAIKIGGKTLHKEARAGRTIERPARTVHIRELELLESFPGDEYGIRVVCSAGTYIRTLVDDMGAALGCGATLTALRRTRTGRFHAADAHTPDDIAAHVERGDIASLLIPVDSLFSEHPPLTLPPDAERLFRNGVPLTLPKLESEFYRVYSVDGTFLSFAKVYQEKKPTLRAVRNFFDADVRPVL